MKAPGHDLDEGCFMALDAGGTMTDVVVVRADGTLAEGKALTDPDDESSSFLGAVKDVAEGAGWSSAELLGATHGCVYAGTLMLNALLTRRGRRVGLIVTRGLEDYPLMERGEGAWLGSSYSERLHSVTHGHQAPYIPRRLVRGVQERIDCFGRVVVPLRADEVERAVEFLVDEEVEAIAVLLLFSHLNRAHEVAVASIAREVLAARGHLEISVVCSSDVSQGMKEYSRLAATTTQAYAAEHARAQLVRVEEQARAAGYRRDLLTLLAHGGVADTRYPRLYESYVSGPVGGVMGAKFLAGLLGHTEVVTADVGGTSTDVGIITGGLVPITREPIVGHLRANLPTILTQSLGAGTGAVLWVDPVTRKLELGPESAGARVGRCYRYPRPTITDCEVALGYLDPLGFLGGQVVLDPSRARQAVEELAGTLGGGMEETAFGAVEYLNDRMRQHLAAMLVGRGYRPEDYTLLGFGGGGPLHLWGLAAGMGFRAVLTVPFAAVFSAFGILTTDHSYRYHRSILAAAPPGDDPVSAGVRQAAAATISQAWQELEQRSRAELAAGGHRGEVRFEHAAYVRFAGQLSDHEVISAKPRLEGEKDLAELCAEFERVYETLYPAAAKHTEAGYQILEVAVTASVATAKPQLAVAEELSEPPPEAARKGERRAYFGGEWLPFSLYEMARLGAGNVVEGPSIVEDAATTLLVPPGHRIRLDNRRLIAYEATQ